VILCGVAGGIYLLRAPRLYRATTTLQVENDRERLVEGAQRSEETLKEDVVKTVEQNLLSPALIQNLARNADLISDPSFLPKVPRPAADETLRLAIRGKIAVSVRRGTRLIDVTAEDENPAIAQKLSRMVVEEFFRSSAQTRSGIALEAHRYLQEEADRVEERLAKSENALQQYKEEHRAVSLDEKQNIVVERLKELNAKVTEARAERLRLETEHAQIQAMAKKPAESLLALPSIAGAPEVEQVRAKIREKEIEIAALPYRSGHPAYNKGVAELEELRAALRDAIGKASERISAGLEGVRVTEGKLEEALRSQEQVALDLSKVAIPYQALEREVNSDRALLALLLARAKEAAVSQGITQPVHVVSPALLPERPSKPSKRTVMLLSVAGGGALGLSLALAAGLLQGTVRTVDEAEQLLGLRCLGAIPHSRRVKRGARHLALVDEPHSATAETIRALRTALSFAAPEGGFRTVLFTSAIPGEGKSFCAMNYAVALALQGDRTLLVDADLRQPTIGPDFLNDKDGPGASDLLLGDCAWDQAIKLTSIENLSILPAGRPVPNPAEMLGRAPFVNLLQTALGRFDRIVIDTAPIHAVSETLLLAAQAQAVCLVVRSGKTGSNVALRALRRLQDAQAHVVGFVLNGLPTGNRGYYYHYHARGYGGSEVYGGTRNPASRRFL
jgi:capsular exopolysaccharide synthesis family protein